MIITSGMAASEFLRRYRERLSAEKMFVDLQHGQEREELHCVMADMHQDGAGLWADQALAVGDQVFISIAMQKVYALTSRLT